MIQLRRAIFLRATVSVSFLLARNRFSLLRALDYHIPFKLRKTQQDVSDQDTYRIIAKDPKIDYIDCHAAINQFCD